MSFVQLLLREPELFDPLQEWGETLQRKQHSKSTFSTMQELNRVNGLMWTLGGSEETLSNSLCDCLTGSSNKTGTEIAHILPHAVSKEPALWILTRMLGVAPWGPQNAVREYKQRISNLLHLPESFHSSWDSGKADCLLRLSASSLRSLIHALEVWLAEEESLPSPAPFPHFKRWRWDLAQLPARLLENRQALSLAREPVQEYVPMWIPSGPNICPKFVAYEFKSIDGVVGDELTKVVSSDPLIPESLPANYTTRSKGGWSPGERADEQLRPVYLAACPISMAGNSIMAQARRKLQTPSQDLLFSDRTFLDNSLFSIDRTDDVSRLEDYFYSLLCSQFPSAFRDMQRPDDLLPLPRPPLQGAPCHMQRAWVTDLLGVDRSKADRDKFDPDSSEDQDTARARWKLFVRFWRQKREAVFSISLQMMLNDSEPLPTQWNPDKEKFEQDLSCFWQAAREVGYAHANDSSFGPVLERCQEDIDQILVNEVVIHGPSILLQKAEACVQGLSSFRLMVHLMNHAVSEDRR
ncbi:unnamed protein product [Sympodiomycopsis kandeliae]